MYAVIQYYVISRRFLDLGYFIMFIAAKEYMTLILQYYYRK